MANRTQDHDHHKQDIHIFYTWHSQGLTQITQLVQDAHKSCTSCSHTAHRDSHSVYTVHYATSSQFTSQAINPVRCVDTLYFVTLCVLCDLLQSSRPTKLKHNLPDETQTSGCKQDVHDFNMMYMMIQADNMITKFWAKFV